MHFNSSHLQVEELNIGMKDTSKTAFAVWDALLHAPGPHKRAPTGAMSSTGLSALVLAGLLCFEQEGPQLLRLQVQPSVCWGVMST